MRKNYLRFVNKFYLFLILSFSSLSIIAQVNLLTVGTKDASTTGGGILSINTLKQSKVLHSFPVFDPASPTYTIADVNGKLFGITTQGGLNTVGTIYSINPDGSNFKILYHVPVNGSIHYRAFAFGPDKKLYFVESTNLCSLDTSNNTVSRIAKLPNYPAYEQHITIDSIGWLYSLFYNDLGYRTMYKIKIDGSGYQQMYTFNNRAEGYVGRFDPVIAPNGRLYGLCMSGGVNERGSFYSMKIDGSDFTVHYSFDSTEKGFSILNISKPVFVNGKILFVTLLGGENGFGTVLSFDIASNTISPIFHFVSSSPVSPIITGGSKMLGFDNTGIFSLNIDGTNFQHYNTTDIGSELTFIPSINKINYFTSGGLYKNGALFTSSIATLNTVNIYNFGNVPEGYNPGKLVKSSTGSIYGITSSGGATGGGTLFKLDKYGENYQMLSDFTTNGIQKPDGRLIILNEKLYGVCKVNGLNNAGLNTAIFSIDTTGQNFSLVKIFDQTEGGAVSGLTEADGILYGAATFPDKTSYVYRINTNGNDFAKLKTFSPVQEGSNPLEGIVYYQGFLYGAMSGGGQYSGGTIYRVGINGSNFNLIHTLEYPDYVPNQGLTLASDNKIYGYTWFGGTTGRGVVFSIDPVTLNYQLIYNNDFPFSDYCIPLSRIFEASDGRLYYNVGAAIVSINKDGSAPKFLYGRNFWSGYNHNNFIEIPDANNLCENNAGRLVSPVAGNNYTYQWQVDEGTGYKNLSNSGIYSGVNTSTLALSSISPTTSNNKYRCAVNAASSGIIYTQELTAKIQNFWLGTVDTNWNNPANWSCNKIPDNNTAVFVPLGLTNYPIINSTVTCKSIEVQYGATFTIGTGGDLQLTGH